MPEYKNLIPRVIKKKQRNDQNETKRVQGNDGKTLCMYCGKGYKRVGGHEPYCNNNPNKRKRQQKRNRSIVHDNETKEHEPKEHRSRSYNKPPIGNIQHIYDIPLMPDF
eukprot:286612_1